MRIGNYTIMSVKDAQRDAESNPDMLGHVSYWRTSQGHLRMTGYVAISDDRQHQYWAKTKGALVSFIRVKTGDNQDAKNLATRVR